MFKKFKTLTALIISAALILPVVSAFAETEGADTSASYDETAGDITVLKELGMLKGDEEGNLNLEQVLKRSDFAFLIHRMHNIPDPENIGDVISFVYDHGYMVGDTVEFRPDDEVTYAEAVTALIKTLGYGAIAERNGGYPTGYITKAAELGITDTLERISGDTPVSRGYAVRLIFNAMRADLPDSYIDPEMNIVPVEGKTMFSTYYDVNEYSGQINANEYSVLYGSSVPKENQVSVSDIVYNVGKTDISDYLGYYVDYICKLNSSDGTSTILTYELTKGKNHTLTIDADDIEDVNDANITYYEDDKLRREDNNISTIVYNGKVEELDFDLLKPDEGRITLMGTSDGEYKYAFVEDVKTYVARRAVLSENLIFDKLGKEPLKVDETDKDILMTISDTGEKVQLDAVEENDVLSVRESLDGEFINITVFKDYTYTGILNGTTGEGDYIIDGFEVEASYALTDAIDKGADLEELKFNKRYKFYLNEFDKIVYYINSEEEAVGYAYLLNMWLDEDGEEIVKARIFNSMGKVQELELADKTILNNSGIVDNTDVLAFLGGQGNVKQQFIYYETNAGGFLKTLKTAVSGLNDDEFSIDYDCNMEEDKQLTFYGDTFGHRYTISGKGIIFWKNPDVAGERLTERDIKTVTLTDIQTQTRYYADVYDSTPMGEADMIVITQELHSTLEELTAGYMVINTIGKAVDSEDEVLYRVNGFTRDGEQTLFFDENAEIAMQTPPNQGNHTIPYEYYDKISSVTDLKPGDVIRFVTDSTGKINLYAPMFLSPYGHPELTYEDDEYIDTESSHYAAGWTSWCHMYDINDKYISFKSTRVAAPNSNGEKVNTVFKRDSRTPICLYDSEEETVTQIGYDDIITLNQSETAADKMLIRVYQGVVRFVVIYR